MCEHNDPISLPDNGLLESMRTMDLREIDFVVEIGTVRRTRKRVAQAIQSVVGGEVRHTGRPYVFDPWEVVDEQGRTMEGDSAFRSGRSAPGAPPALEAESSTEAGPQTRPPAFGEDVNTQTEGETAQ